MISQVKPESIETSGEMSTTILKKKSILVRKHSTLELKAAHNHIFLLTMNQMTMSMSMIMSMKEVAHRDILTQN